MPKKRRLSDLYVVGKELVFSDGGGSVSVWIQKLNQIEHEKAYRLANAKRARTLSVYADQDSDEHQGLLSEVNDMSLEEIVEIQAQGQLNQKRPAIEAEHEAEEEWSKDNYLQGLNDAWDGGLSETYAKDSKDKEAKRVFKEIQRFVSEVESLIEGEADRIRQDVAGRSEDELRKEAFQASVRMQADLAWLTEFRRCELWLSVRDVENHREYYFESRDEVDELSQVVLEKLAEAYREISVELTEGKSLGETPNSSTPSESVDKSEVA